MKSFNPKTTQHNIAKMASALYDAPKKPISLRQIAQMNIFVVLSNVADVALKNSAAPWDKFDCIVLTISTTMAKDANVGSNSLRRRNRALSTSFFSFLSVMAPRYGGASRAENNIPQPTIPCEVCSIDDMVCVDSPDPEARSRFDSCKVA